MEKYCATSDVKCIVGADLPPLSTGLTSNTLLEVQKFLKPTNSQTGVSTNNVLLGTSITTNRKSTDAPHWYALHTAYDREKKAYDYLISKNVVAFYSTLKRTKIIAGKRIVIKESHILCIQHRRRIKDFCLRQRKPSPHLFLLSIYSRWQQDCQGIIGSAR